MKYILVTGGVISGVGKGIVTSSIGALLKACDLKVNAIKIDPYINIDAGLFSPFEHGEVFVLDDGCEVDLDLGNYERFLDTKLTRMNNITTGKIYQSVIEKERRGDYQGKTVQIIPHITDAIQEWIETTSKGNDPQLPADVCVIELGGTIGDIEGMPFVEALRQLRRRVHRENFLICHVNPVSSQLGMIEEFKTKPLQNCLKDLRACGLIPDLIVCRSIDSISAQAREKVSLFSEVDSENIFNVSRMKSIYQVPNELEKQGILRSISNFLKMDLCNPGNGLLKWSQISDIAVNANCEINIALVGKYTDLRDSYLSVMKALEHACYSKMAKPKIAYIDSTLLENGLDNQAWKELKGCDCLIVPGGFGIRGTEGKIKAIKWARENKVPFLGICLGFQLAVIEYARNVLSMDKANSEEFVTDHKRNNDELVIVEMLDYQDPERKLGGTMRLGLKKTKLIKDSILKRLYGDKGYVFERHRHRYEVNPDYVHKLENNGLKFVGKNDDESRMEILELDPKVHPYFVAVQYHPEYLTRPFRPSPPYVGLIEAALVCRKM